jgi:hypothetical protein
LKVSQNADGGCMDEEQLALVEEGLNLLLQKYKKNQNADDRRKVKAVMDVFVINKEGIVKYAQVLESAGDLPDFEAIKNCLKELN